MSTTLSGTDTYTNDDIKKVARKFTADLMMIVQSTAALDEAKARQYAHDIEVLASAGHLEAVDLTLLQYGVELRAARYDVNTSAGDLVASRPGDVLWPRVSSGTLRVIVFYASSYTQSEREKLTSKLKISWSTSYDDTSHSSLTEGKGRNYVSNGWGLQRKDFA